ncbi:MAG: PilN domain-containing protein [Granulosicoccus sp.]|nr:PilN domain-containing protein [Granulosicoccus sp.]
MTKINLLPWRETHRREKNTEFGITLALFAMLTAGVAFGGFKYVEGKVDFQNERNARLDREIALLQQELQAIQELEETKNNLLARMEIIQQLQGQRPLIVHTFQEVAESLPDGVYLTALKQNGGNKMTMEGRAESNARVSALMRRIDNSNYFKNPRLEVIAADREVGFSTFKLSVDQDVPKVETGEADGI